MCGNSLWCGNMKKCSIKPANWKSLKVQDCQNSSLRSKIACKSLTHETDFLSACTILSFTNVSILHSSQCARVQIEVRLEKPRRKTTDTHIAVYALCVVDRFTDPAAAYRDGCVVAA